MKDDIEKTYEEFDEDSFLVDYKKKENKFMSALKRFIVWFATSSVNREKWALTLKAGVPFLVLLNISDNETLEALAGSIGHVIANLAEFIAGSLTVWGLLRKIWFSFKE